MASTQYSFERREEKYFLTPVQYEALLTPLRQHMHADEHEQYTVCSLYCDTPDWQLIRTSLEKPYYKEKLRVRSYGTPTPDGRVFVELKKKVGGIVYKRRVCMPYGDALRYLSRRQPGGDGQIFQEFNTGMEEIIVGVVGVLQFDVLKYRLENEYNVEIRLEPLPYEHIRWIENKDIDLNKLTGTSDMKKIQDLKGNPLLLFVNSWSVGMTLDRNEGLILSEFGRN